MDMFRMLNFLITEIYGHDNLLYIGEIHVPTWEKKVCSILRSQIGSSFKLVLGYCNGLMGRSEGVDPLMEIFFVVIVNIILEYLKSILNF